MNQRPSPNRKLSPVQATCAHCGLEVPARLIREGDEHQFCCSGCRSVYGLLNELGMDSYYQLLESQGAQGRPPTISGRGFEDFDALPFIERHGQDTASGGKRIKIYLEGVHCAACVWLVEELPRVVDGLRSVRLNLATAVAEVEWDPAEVRLSAVARALDQVGYTPHLRGELSLDEVRKHEDRTLLIRIGVASVSAMNIMFIQGALYAGEYQGMATNFVQFFRWITLGLATPVVLYSARPFFVAAWAGLRRRVPHMDLPISIAIIGAFAFSVASTVRGSGDVYFDSLTALVALLLGARYVQQRAQRAAMERTESLRGVAFVEYARRLDDDGLSVEVPVSALKAGDRVVVRSGELIPADGKVLDGHSSLDKAVLTGEPDPVATAPGDLVYAGATNLGARLVVDVQATGEETRVGALLALVDEAMSQRAPLVQLADRISRYFVVAVLVLAAAAGLLAYAQTPGDPGAILQRIIALLVVSCPCALGLATPVALTVSLTRAARAGIFIKNPDVIEQLGKVDTLLLDKTGTLTEGKATVQRWIGDESARELAFALEAESAHPVAQAFRRSLAEPVRQARLVSAVTERAGLGISGSVDGQPVVVGNEAMLAAQQITLDQAFRDHARQLIDAGLSPVFIAVDGQTRGVCGIGDRLRDDALQTIASLKARGVRPCILSGDHPAVVARVAAALQIPVEDALGGLSPEDKRDHVQALLDGSRRGILPRRSNRLASTKRRDAASTQGAGKVAMVGDGVNDAAALALADVGVAVQGGAGASIVAADVVLTRPGLAPLLQLFSGSSRVVGVVRRNLLFSLAYNITGASLALFGFVGPLVAALLMPVSSLTVILSSATGRTFQQETRR